SQDGRLTSALWSDREPSPQASPAGAAEPRSQRYGALQTQARTPSGVFVFVKLADDEGLHASRMPRSREILDQRDLAARYAGELAKDWANLRVVDVVLEDRDREGEIDAAIRQRNRRPVGLKKRHAVAEPFSREPQHSRRNVDAERMRWALLQQVLQVAAGATSQLKQRPTRDVHRRKKSPERLPPLVREKGVIVAGQITARQPLGDPSGHLRPIVSAVIGRRHLRILA